MGDKIGEGGDGAAAEVKISSRMRGEAANDHGKIPRAFSSTDERTIRQRWLENETELISFRSLGEQRCRTGRADFFIGVEQNFPGDIFRKLAFFKSAEREKHDEKPAFCVSDAGAGEGVFIDSLHMLKWMLSRINRVEVYAEKYFNRRQRAFDKTDGARERRVDDIASGMDRFGWRHSCVFISAPSAANSFSTAAEYCQAEKILRA